MTFCPWWSFSLSNRIYGRPDPTGPGSDPGCESVKSDWSNGRLIDLKGEHPSDPQRWTVDNNKIWLIHVSIVIYQEEFLLKTCMFVVSICVCGSKVNFLPWWSSFVPNRIYGRPDCAGFGPEPSCVSLKSDWSNGRLLDFKREQPSAAQR